MTTTSRLDIDLTAIDRNVGVVRRALAAHLPKGRPIPAVCAVLKADAYSLGAPRIAKRLSIASSGAVEMIAVYTPDQARALIEAAVQTPILLLMPVRDLDRSDVLYRAATKGRLHLVIHDTDNLNHLIDRGNALGVSLPLHVEVDTGMTRGGMSPEEASGVLARIREHPRLRLAGIFTHCASSDRDPESVRRQAERFNRFLEQHAHLIPDDCLVHQANTFGLFRTPGLHRNMVRVGLALLGYAAEEFADPEHFELADLAAELSPAVRWTSHIVHLKSVPSGTPVGYGGTFRTTRPSRIALVPVGYADGYPLALSNAARVGVLLPGENPGAPIRAFAPVVGRVSMDQITLDVTDLPEGSVRIGSAVEIVSADRTAPNHLPTLARQAGTIAHELLCRLSPRLPRHYTAVEESPTQAGPVIASIGRAAVGGR
ncbi:MAG: alanine racemase [Phycisphaerales bacterium]|nr:alanine racemase [Phycisphaerales bacterium]